MKKTFTYVLIFLVSFAYNYETVQLFSQAIGGHSISWMDDFDCEEKNEKSENEKDDKSKFSNDSDSNAKLISSHTQSGDLDSKQNINFSSSDYSQVVYSPPEMA